MNKGHRAGKEEEEEINSGKTATSRCLLLAFRIGRLGDIWIEFRRAHKRVEFAVAFACRQANVIETIEEIKENRE
jgi:very-short-patch-repair endonuclease